jgi:hypothetical protein
MTPKNTGGWADTDSKSAQSGFESQWGTEKGLVRKDTRETLGFSGAVIAASAPRTRGLTTDRAAR